MIFFILENLSFSIFSLFSLVLFVYSSLFLNSLEILNVLCFFSMHLIESILHLFSVLVIKVLHCDSVILIRLLNCVFMLLLPLSKSSNSVIKGSLVILLLLELHLIPSLFGLDMLSIEGIQVTVVLLFSSSMISVKLITLTSVNDRFIMSISTLLLNLSFKVISFSYKVLCTSL